MTHANATVLVTGGYGCIRAETTKWILRNTGASVVAAGRRVDADRTTRVFHDVDQTNLITLALDIQHADQLAECLSTHNVTHVVHLAALQTPDCNAYRDLGLQINLAGTQHLVECMKTAATPIERFVFASSVAVYGPRSHYPAGQVPMLAEPHPVNVYGAWKLAGENISRMFHEDTGVPTVSIRPGVLFGPGRDAGLTSTPTTAMKCAALGLPYQIPYANRQDYLYAPDVGAAFACATLDPFEGHSCFTLPSQTLDTQTIVEAIQQSAGDLGLSEEFQISIGTETVPFICDLEHEPFRTAFPNAPLTPISTAVRESLSVFQQQIERGWLTKADIPN